MLNAICAYTKVHYRIKSECTDNTKTCRFGAKDAYVNNMSLVTILTGDSF